MKRNEVAEKMSISPETVKSQLALAVAHIRASVGKNHVVLALVLLSRWT
jgi:DNA-directed RNA polymerase specialized sigma24 family protein